MAKFRITIDVDVADTKADGSSFDVKSGDVIMWIFKHMASECGLMGMPIFPRHIKADTAKICSPIIHNIEVLPINSDDQLVGTGA